jgi:penicillin amidase
MKPSSPLRWAIRIVLILTAVLAIFAAYTVRRSFPRTSGEIAVAGLQAPVDVYRDSLGVPHIYAANEHDLFFAQGYLHAQDRFWQMDFWRHIGSGRLAEMFGEGQLDTDRFLRTLGWARVVEQELGLASKDTRTILNAYADGVNAYLSEQRGAAISLEYAVLGLLNPEYEVEPWQPLHTLTWAKAMAWDLRGNMEEEIERALLAPTLGLERLQQLYPDYPAEGPFIVQGSPSAAIGDDRIDAASPSVQESLAALRQRIAALDALTGGGEPGLGSNNWVLAGSRTATGSPIVANDPHLSIQMPSIWYQIGLHCRPVSEACRYEVAGVSFAGAPGVIVGHNADLAWGVTNTGPDVIDLYYERVNPENPNQYEVNGEWVDMTTVEETIGVSGGSAIPLTVRYTRHGPVVSDTYEDATAVAEAQGPTESGPIAISMRWTALEPNLLYESVLEYNRARTVDEFRQALRKFAVPAQNFVFADRQGNIGYQMPGNIPVRAAGDGWMPVPGWTGEHEWTGYIPFEDLPRVENPPEGFVMTANHAVVGPAYPHLITRDWDYGYRAERLLALLTAQDAFSIEDVQRIQSDNYHAMAPIFVPLLQQISFEDDVENKALALLSGWDYQADGDSPAAAVFNAFFRHLVLLTYGDEVLDRLPGSDRAFRVLEDISVDSGSAWWDDVGTDSVEDRTATIRMAFQAAVAELRQELGGDPSAWTWGELHGATFRNQTFGESGIAPIEALFNRGPFPTGGGGSIVNATGWRWDEGYAVTSLPSMRMIQDLSDWDRSLLIHTTGQSGHAFHPHYVDMAPVWSQAQYAPFLWSDNAVQGAAVDHLVLVPGG